MKTPNPKNYDFLWLVYNYPYLVTSFKLTEEFLKRDFIVTGKGAEWKLYVGKKERARLSQVGLQFFEKHFPQYKVKVRKATDKAYPFFKKISRKKFSSLSDLELRRDFLETINFVQSLWALYFFTEYFLYDKIQATIEEGKENGRRLLSQVQEMRKLKFNLRKVVDKTVFRGNIFELYLKEIKKRTKRERLSFYHYQEIADLLAGEKVKKVNRQNYVTGKFSNWQPIIGEQALKIIKFFDEALLEEGKGKELRGQVANHGFYKGRVKIIPFDVKKDLTKKIAKMKKGDILVTGSTNPNMILACKKAGAIVTEEGGIASHAAIVSRELNIPCIIGTKIATQIFKDGDLIEVDANKGIVKKLE